MATTWTPERRARQAAMIHTWAPWERSTGPKTATGKATSAANRRKSLDEAEMALAEARARVRRLRGR